MHAYSLFIGLRYSFSARRQRLASVIAVASMLGMMIGVASLITVLAVMNGFSAEMRTRILALVPHGYVESTEPLKDWPAIAEQINTVPEVVAVSPYWLEKVLLAGEGVVQGAQMKAVDINAERHISSVAQAMTRGAFDTLDQSFAAVLGAGLARALRVSVGDRITVTLPRLTVTPLGVFPRTKSLKVVGLFEVGAQMDSYQFYVSLATAQRLLSAKGQVGGLQVRTVDLYDAPQVLAKVASALGADYKVTDWSQTQGSLFRAVKMEKIMVTLLLFSVVAVAAFNIISTLALSVTEKRGDIAVLRALGASRGGILLTFLIHGLALSALGIFLGVAVGVALALNIAGLTRAVEQWFGVHLFDPSVYFIAELPAQLHWQDVALVVMVSVALSFFASLYPAWRAATVAPAEVLRYE